MLFKYNVRHIHMIWFCAAPWNWTGLENYQKCYLSFLWVWLKTRKIHYSSQNVHWPKSLARAIGLVDFFSALTEFFNCRGDLYVGSLKHILSSFCIVAAALYRVRMYRMRYRVVQTRWWALDYLPMMKTQKKTVLPLASLVYPPL